jgi:hypothetical protein
MLYASSPSSKNASGAQTLLRFVLNNGAADATFAYPTAK